MGPACLVRLSLLFLTQPTPPTEPNTPVCEFASPPDTAAGKSEVVRQRVFQFENHQVRVWKTSLRARESVHLHHNPKARVLVPLADAEVTEIDSEGHRRVLVMKAGRSYWRPGDPNGVSQADSIESSADVDVMVIELKN